MKHQEKIIGKIERQKRRALELYAHDTPFKPKVEPKFDQFKRKPKHAKSIFTDF